MNVDINLASVYDRCVSELKKFIEDAGFKDVVIGLSGGIDSSLVAVMAVDAFGPSCVHGVLLPGPYSTDHSISDALELAANLNIEAKTISISEPFHAFEEAFKDGYGQKLQGLAAENTQARCRMTCIMALSNTFGWMMLNTGNKSEAAMGYSTLYGDTAGAFAPIGGVYKTDVFRLVKWRNEKSLSKGEVAPIPKNVLIKPPSAELSPNQSDETSMGVTYDALDKILKAHLECGMSVDEIVSEGFELSLVEMVLKRYAANAFKRAMEPPCVDVYSSCAPSACI